MNGGTQVEITEARWRNYPLLDAALVTTSPSILKSIERTKAQIEHVVREGTGREQERARLAQGAYARATALYDHLVGLRKVASNNRPEGTITD